MPNMDYNTGECLTGEFDSQDIETAEFACKMQDETLGWVCGFAGVLESKDTRFTDGFAKTAQCPNCDNEIIAE